MSAPYIPDLLLEIDTILEGLPATARKAEAMFVLGWVLETCYEAGVSSAEVIALELTPPGKPSRDA